MIAVNTTYSVVCQMDVAAQVAAVLWSHRQILDAWDNDPRRITSSECSPMWTGTENRCNQSHISRLQISLNFDRLNDETTISTNPF